MLHARGIQIIPVTIEIGDYVLSPWMCVERKSIPDLFGSFSTGRLYNQIEAICRHYKQPILLIEFDRNKPFSLLIDDELSAEITSKAITSKITLLVLHFPLVRLVWSRDATATASLFVALKAGQLQPEPSLPMISLALGSDDDSESSFNDESAVGEDMTPHDILRTLPGITTHNIRNVLNHVESLFELTTLSQEELGKLIGELNARKLHAFLQKDLTTAFAAPV